MATSKANLMQTAVNASTAFVGALVGAGLIGSVEEARTEVDAERDRIFTILGEQPADAPQGGGVPAARSGGSSNVDTSNITVEDAASTVYNYGKFAGVTLGAILEMDGDACANYGYGEGDKTGRDYMTYLSKNDKNKFIQPRAKVLLGQ